MLLTVFMHRDWGRLGGGGGAKRPASGPQPWRIPGTPLGASPWRSSHPRRAQPRSPGADLPAATCPAAGLRRKAQGGGKPGLTWGAGPAPRGGPGYSLSHSSSAAAGPGGPSADSAPAAAPAPAATAVAVAAIGPAPQPRPRPPLPFSRRRLACSGAADAAGEGRHVMGRGPWCHAHTPGHASAQAPGRGCSLPDSPPPRAGRARGLVFQTRNQVKVGQADLARPAR